MKREKDISKYSHEGLEEMLVDFIKMDMYEYINKGYVGSYSPFWIFGSMKYKQNIDFIFSRKHTIELEGYRPHELDEICIMTLHKSKGLEFEIVFHMDLYDWTFPRRNISDEDWKQTLNLHYVGITRAKQVCYIMQGTKRYRPFNDDFIDASESPFLYLNNVQKYRKNIRWDKV